MNLHKRYMIDTISSLNKKSKKHTYDNKDIFKTIFRSSKPFYSTKKYSAYEDVYDHFNSNTNFGEDPYDHFS